MRDRVVSLTVVLVDFDVDFTVEDRTALEAITVCCVCGKPIEPKDEREYEAAESLGCHVGGCFHALKRDLAGMEARGPLPLPAAEAEAPMSAQARRLLP
jgi:hypothetical protein